MAKVTTPVVVVSQGPEETREIGERLGRLLQRGDVVLLHGDLGSGKTTLTQGIARGLGIHEYVQSPTFTLVAEHERRRAGDAPVRLYHLDLYRLTDESELESFGFDQYLAPADGVAVIEWPERAGDWLPDRYILVRLQQTKPEVRRLVFEGVPVGAFTEVLVRM